jgi:hypothetical protein
MRPEGEMNLGLTAEQIEGRRLGIGGSDAKRVMDGDWLSLWREKTGRAKPEGPMAIQPGHWMVRCCRFCPEVPTRIWLCDHEPGLPENKVDQPYLQGQIGLDLVPPADVWAMLEFVEAPAEQQELFSRPLPLRVDVRAGLAMKPTTAPMAKWKRERARRITPPEFEAGIVWLRWAEKNAPSHPDFNYRRPIDPAAMPVPRFQRRML